MIMLVTFLIPILIIVVLITIGILLSNRKGRPFFYSHRIKWLLGGYMCILIVAVCFFFLIPSHTTEGNQGEYDFDQQNFYDLVMNGKIEQIDPKYIDHKEEWVYEKDELKIINEGSYVQIVIDRKEVNDGLIEVTSYRGRSMIYHIDYTDQLPPTNMSLLVDTLLFHQDFVELKYSTIESEFTITQFSENSQGMFKSDHQRGEQLIYIRVPKDLTIVDEFYNLDISYLE